MNSRTLHCSLNRRPACCLERISKATARRLFIENKEPLALCPVNLRPGDPWNPQIVINPGVNRPCDAAQFSNVVGMFEYYNCINSETGKYAAFYRIKEI